MNREDLITSGIIKEGNETEEVDAMLNAYASFLSKKIDDGEKFYQDILKVCSKGKKNRLDVLINVHDATVELLAGNLENAERYRDALKLEKLEDKVKNNTKVYIESRQKRDLLANCLSDEKAYDVLCRARGQNPKDINFREVVIDLKETTQKRYEVIREKFFDQFVEYNVESDLRLKNINNQKIK